ncbi:DegT/DnrJ/EryC1/StrS family aminotransferase [Candidatus Parcubacteria bacterium]|nr:DegT/DnrJ/EryC1/StrS family aminotransferase [Candidatus Parcubacteria bacterium]
MDFKVRFVNYSLQYQNLKEEIDATMQDVLNRGDLINRQDVEEFESGVASFIGVKHAVSLNSGTDALIFALMAAGVGSGDEVITVSHTFVASISCIAHCGATPILIEVREDFNMDVDKLEQAITPKTKAIIPVYLNGRMCDMEKIMAIAEKHNLIVVEDSAQALGAKFKGEPSGSIGLAGCFSFYPAKILGCFGDGGMLTTNDSAIAEKVTLLRDHGQKTKTDILCYGFTSRLDNLQAAVLSIRLRCLPENIRKRREIAEIYNNKLADVTEIKLPPAPNDEYFDVYQNYVLKAQKRDELFAYLKENGVETLIKDPIPNHWHKGLNLSHFVLPYTEQLAKEVISLPMYPELTNKQVDYVIDCVHNFYLK